MVNQISDEEICPEEPAAAEERGISLRIRPGCLSCLPRPCRGANAASRRTSLHTRPRLSVLNPPRQRTEGTPFSASAQPLGRRVLQPREARTAPWRFSPTARMLVSRANYAGPNLFSINGTNQPLSHSIDTAVRNSFFTKDGNHWQEVSFTQN
jgi:hypothetical protein